MNIEQIVVERLGNLPPEKQQEVLNFLDSLLNQKPNGEFKHPDGTPMSAWEAAKKWAGCLDSGPADLSTNKNYLEGLGIE